MTVNFKKKHKILFLISRFLDGGIDTVLTEYLTHLSDISHYEVTLAVGIGMGELEVYRNKIPKSVHIVYFVEDGYLTKYPKLRAYHRLPSYKKFFDETLLNPVRRQMIKRRLNKLAAGYDVVIDFDCCFYTYLKDIKTRKLVWYHFSFEQTMRLNERRMRRIAAKLEYYDKIVTISESMCEEGRRIFPWLKDKLIVIYNPKNQQHLLQQAEEKPDNELIEKPFLLAVERLEESQKDITTLLKAYKLYREKYGHTESLYLIGKGNSESQLRETAQQLGIGEQVFFLGFIANPFPWMKACRMLVHSARFEGLPTVLIEGLMLDKLIVASDCPTGPREILAGGKAGMLVPAGDSDAFAQAMHEAMTDVDLQQKLKENIKAQQAVFSFETIEKQFAQIV